MTAVPSVVRVRPYMILQRFQSRITFIAVLTAEVPFAGVGSHMLFQPGGKVEPLVAILTLMFEHFLMVASLMFC